MSILSKVLRSSEASRRTSELHSEAATAPLLTPVSPFFSLWGWGCCCRWKASMDVMMKMMPGFSLQALRFFKSQLLYASIWYDKSKISVCPNVHDIWWNFACAICIDKRNHCPLCTFDLPAKIVKLCIYAGVNKGMSGADWLDVSAIHIWNPGTTFVTFGSKCKASGRGCSLCSLTKIFF